MFSVGRGVREEGILKRIQRGGSEEAIGVRESGVESKEKSGEEIEQRETEELGVEDERLSRGY